ncbi:MAG: hypothetical protein R3C15_20000 [Thermoleophilia bacterium]
MRRILLLVSERVTPDELAAVRDDAGLEDAAEIRVVSPVTKLTPLKWLANEEDAAREEAERTTRQAAKVLDRATPGEVVVHDAGAGDTDPLLAIEDALAQFPAEELVVVTAPPGRGASWLEEGLIAQLDRFALPTRHVVVER